VSFSSFAEFLAMGDHGLYVWLSYGVALIMVIYNVLSVRVRQRRALQAVRDSARRGAVRREGASREAVPREGAHREGVADQASTVGKSEVR